MDFIEALEESLGKKAVKNMLPIQAGDVPATWADVSDLTSDLNYKPFTPVKKGIENFVQWYRAFYKG
jgi:UDP-glucuronate 4-epimerase